MKIYNPSNNAINDVRIYGVLYSIEAEGTLENVPEEHARYWQSLHSFLQIKKDSLELKKEEVIEVPKPKIEEVIQAPVIEATVTVESNPSTVVIEQTPVVEEAVVPVKSKGRPKIVK